MMHAGKLLTLCAALGIGLAAPGYAEDTAEYTPQANASAADAPEQLTVIVTEPSLVFSDGAWYTFVDGTWYELDGAQWQSLTEESTDSSAAFDSASSDYAYNDAEEVWYVWVPVSHGESEYASYDDTSSPSHYDADVSSVNGIPVYSHEDGSWYVLAPMASDDMTSVVYVY